MYSNNTKNKLCTYTMLLNFLEISDAFFVSHAKSLYKIFSRGEVFMWPNVRSTHVLLTEVSNSYEKTSQMNTNLSLRDSLYLESWRRGDQKFKNHWIWKIISQSNIALESLQKAFKIHWIWWKSSRNQSISRISFKAKSHWSVLKSAFL